jgi:ubiquinone/menaquinone biosynthesis C-methylase UbiE
MSEYIHGTEPEEQQRLTLLNTILLNEGTLHELRLQKGDRILDVGSGLGQLSRAMARQAKTRAIAIERSEEQIAEAARQAKTEGEEHLVEFRQGDATDLPLRGKNGIRLTLLTRASCWSTLKSHSSSFSRWRAR